MLIPKRLLIFLIIVSINTPACFAAETSPKVTPVYKNDSVPFDGILFPAEDANKVRQAIIENDSLTIINTSLQNSLKLQDDAFNHQQVKVQLLLDQNDKLAQRLGESQSMNTWEKIGWTAFGMFAVGLGAYGLKAVK